MKKSCFKGCFCSKAGFTLIELLVVVLIIGILAAVALPQYQKAVVKNHLATLKAIVTPVAQAAELYYLEQGEYPSRFSDLSVSVLSPQSTTNASDSQSKTETYVYPWGACVIVNGFEHGYGGRNGGQYYIQCYDSQAHIGYIHYLQGTKIFPTGPACNVRDNSAIALAVCQQETGTQTPFYPTSFSYSGKTTP